jgi:hypothetical protein
MQPDDFQRHIKQRNFIVIYCYKMNQHFHSMHISLCLCLRMLPIMWYTIFQPCSWVSQCLPSWVTWHHWNPIPTSMVCDLLVYTFTLGYCQAERWGDVQSHGRLQHSKITCSRNISQPSWMLSFYGQLRHLAGTIWLRAQFHDNSVVVWGSSITFQHNKQMWL